MSGRAWRGSLHRRAPVLAAALALALGLLSALAPAAVRAAESSPESSLELSADSIAHDLDRNQLSASGSVDLRLEGLTAQGERLEADLARHLARMPGPVVLRISAGAVNGQDLEYDWDARQGSLAGVETVSQGMRLSGRGAEVTPEALTVRDGLVTKCVLPMPEYAFLAREIQVDPKTELATARGVQLALFGHRILPLPNMRFSLKDTPVGRLSRERLPIPTTGYDSTRGYFVFDELPVHLSEQAIGLLGAGYGTKEGGRATLTVLHTPSPSVTYRLDARYRGDDPDSGLDSPSPDLDGLLAASVTTRAGRVDLAVEERDDDEVGDLSFLPRVAWAPPATRLGGLTLTPTLEWARLKEGISGAEASRSLGRLVWSTSSHLPGRLTLGLSGTADHAAYGTGQTLTAATLSTAVAYPLSSAVSFRTGYAYSGYSGATPFVFDLPDRFSEAEAGLAWRSGDSSAAVSAVYDVAAGGPESLVPDAVKATLNLSLNDWVLRADVRRELGADPHYSTLSLAVTRQFHCFGLELRAEPLEDRTSLVFVVR